MPLSSKTDICNLALAELGARRITSYDADTTVEANACRLHLDHVIDTLLERHQWSFATARRTLARLNAPPSSEWTAAWQLPGDCVRLIRISTGDTENPLRDFAIEGRKVLTRGGGTGPDGLMIVYVSNARTVPEWIPLFSDAVVYKLAARIAGDVTQNPSQAEGCLQKLESLALPAAQTADARESLSGENFGPRHLASMSALVGARFRADGRPAYTPHI